MSTEYYINSTLSADQIYPCYEKMDVNGVDKGKPYEIDKTIFVKGGAGIVDQRGHTAEIAQTKVTAEELELLKQNGVFNLHVDKGFIVVTEKQTDTAKLLKDMQPQDLGAQLTEDEIEKGSPRIDIPKPIEGQKGVKVKK